MLAKASVRYGQGPGNEVMRWIWSAVFRLVVPFGVHFEKCEILDQVIERFHEGIFMFRLC